MNVLIVYSHPSKESYTYQILEQLKEVLLQRAWSVEISDLYAMDFQSDMSATEYSREGFARMELPLSKDVLNEQEKINKADCVIFLYPVWWSDCPAKLKGWFDRVYSVGFAYKQRDNFPRMARVKFGVVVCTAGHPNDFLKEIGIAQSMENVMLDDRLGLRFENKEMLILGGTLDLERVREGHARDIRNLSERIATYGR